MKKPTTLASDVYERLRHDLVQGAIEPNHRLRMETMRDRYGVGASPIREALNRLASEGLVDQIDKRGFRTWPLTLAELDELMRTRCWVGEIGVRESIEHGDAEWEERCLIAFHRMERGPAPINPDPALRTEADRLHKTFHEQLLSACRSQILIRFWNSLFDRARRYQSLSRNPGNRPPRDVNAEHKALLDAMLKRDVELAARLHTAHIQKTRDILVKAGVLQDSETATPSLSPTA
jgi:DNA-binding GntR family transcriptional regulator